MKIDRSWGIFTCGEGKKILPERYLPDVSRERVSVLLQQAGLSESHLEAVLGLAALCRLAFASVGEAADAPLSSGITEGAVISQTHHGRGRGRPRSARWAFWAAFTVRGELEAQGLRPTSKFLAKLVAILLNRTVPPSEARTVFGKLRAEVRERATAAARRLLEGALKEAMGEREYARWVRANLGEGLNPTTHFPPVVERGKFSEPWLARLLEIRRAILRRTRKAGPLGQGESVLSITCGTRIASGLPLGGSANPGGTIHLGKAMEVPVPGPPPLQGGTIRLDIPLSALYGEPCSAALYALPLWWWKEWAPLWIPSISPDGSGRLSRTEPAR